MPPMRFRTCADCVGIPHPINRDSGGQLFLGFWIGFKIQMLTIYKSANQSQNKQFARKAA